MSEIRLAFEHPEARSRATATEDPSEDSSEDPIDRISVRDYALEAEIGAFQQERGTTQTICFNVVVEVQPLEGPIDDDVDRILSYDRITEAITGELQAERLNLLETLAERVAERILAEPQARRVFVRIEKLDRGPGALGVEIVRSAKPVAVAQDAPHPKIVYLSNQAINAPGLPALIDRLEAEGLPLIFCVGAPEAAAPVSQGAMAQRRINLLALEQNAWVLAGRDDRCVVVASRTELDWAMKNGQPCVWAPSKLVLDAAERPEWHDPLDLTLWFAAQMQAAECAFVGAAPAGPRAAAFPITVLDGA